MEMEIQFSGDPADIAIAAKEMEKILGRGELAKPGAGFFVFRVPAEGPQIGEIRAAIPGLTKGSSLSAHVSEAVGDRPDGPIHSRGI